MIQKATDTGERRATRQAGYWRGSAAPLLATLVVLTTAGRALPDVRLPAIINHNMVLQQEQSVPIWGWAEPGETVTVRIANAQVATVAGPDGTWQVRLPPHKADNTPHELIIAGRNTLTLTNVLFGEVWLCGGQSNMGYDVGGVAESNELVGVSYPTMRQFFMHITPTNTPKRDCIGNWRPADTQNLRRFCAVGFWFAERVQQELHMPIGLVWTAYGSSSVETWIPRTALTNDPDFAPLFERARRADMPLLLAEHHAAMSNWLAQAEAARREGRPEPPKPQDPRELYAYILRHAPGNCFDGGIAPLIPFGLRGVLWYQGEHNAPRGYQYRKLLPILIREWRRLWDNPELYFLIVQLPNYGSTSAEPRDSAWAELREAQWLTAQKEKHCGIAVTIDLGEPRNIHPRNKWDVGKRLALVALNRVYGREDIPYSGPVFTGMTSQDGQLVLNFSHTHGGLVAGTNGTPQPLRGFAVAGAAPAADGRPKFHWAEARIAGNTVILSCTNVPQPVAVRYAWDNSPLANLYNTVGLPAAPFRTDDWPGCTFTNR